MDDQNRRPIGELVARYRFHPELRDLFVEGDRDVSLFRWFLSNLPGKKAVVYHINTIGITRGASQAVGISTEGNKGRVLTLAMTLDKELPLECRSVYCCVDKDFHEFGFALPECRYLVYTGYACMECYALNPNPLSKLFEIYLGKSL